MFTHTPKDSVSGNSPDQKYMEANWECIYTSAYLHTAELFKAILEENNILSIIINNQDSFYKTIGVVELYVEHDNVIAAKRIINENNP